jgi:hypothetical protein
MNMKHRYLWAAAFVLIAGATAARLTLPARSAPLPAKENNQGTVMVSVTPQDFSKSAASWRFEVRFNTHVTPITQDMMKVASLSDGTGAGEPPTAWNGDPPGGHHRRGVLVFKPIEPMPAALMLHIREVGSVADRTFTWKTSP